MNKRIKQAAAALCAFTLSVACITGCSKSEGDSSSSKDNKDTTTEQNKTGKEITDSKLDIYIDKDGAPYYVDEDGTKMMLFSSMYENGEEDPSDNYVYDHYDDNNGLTFDIPDGWYADTSYGSPTMFMQGDEDNLDEYISIVPSSYVLDADEKGNYNTEKVIKSYYEDGISEGYYLSFEITDKGDTKLNGVDAKYYVLRLSSNSFSDSGEEEFIRIKYIITGGDNSHAVIMTALDTDESYNKVVGAFDTIADTVKLPTAEQMAAAEAADEDILEDDEDDTEDDDAKSDGNDIEFNVLQ